MPLSASSPLKTLRVLTAAAVLWLTCLPAHGQTLRISPDALRWRVAVSGELPHSTRLELKDLALNEPIPMEHAVAQTKILLDQRYPYLESDERLLYEFYFLVARLEASHAYSQEFQRREQRLREGLELLDEYQAKLERSVRQNPRLDGPEMEFKIAQELPLKKVGWYRTPSGAQQLLVLHSYPEPVTYWGRDNLSELRRAVISDRTKLQSALHELRRGRREFLNEAATLGWEVERLQSLIRGLVRAPRAGLPFSF